MATHHSTSVLILRIAEISWESAAAPALTFTDRATTLPPWNVDRTGLGIREVRFFHNWGKDFFLAPSYLCAVGADKEA